MLRGRPIFTDCVRGSQSQSSLSQVDVAFDMNLHRFLTHSSNSQNLAISLFLFIRPLLPPFPPSNLLPSALTIFPNHQKFNPPNTAVAPTYTPANHTGTGNPSPVLLPTTHKSLHMHTLWYVPQISLLPAKVVTSMMPFMSWVVEPVMWSLSRNQWMLRKGVESS